MDTTSQTLLSITGLKVAYGGIQAVKGVTLEVREGELVSLIGANGAGKTTTLKAVTGLQPVAAGDIEFMGRSLKGQGPWDLVKQGLVMVPEGRGVFARMTITENLQMGAFVRRDTEMPALMAGRMPALNSEVSRKIWPSVIEITLVGTKADTSPACVSMIGSAVSEPVRPLTSPLVNFST